MGADADHHQPLACFIQRAVGVTGIGVRLVGVCGLGVHEICQRHGASSLNFFRAAAADERFEQQAATIEMLKREIESLKQKEAA